MKIDIFKKGKRFGNEERFLLIALLLFVVYILFVILAPTFKNWSQNIWEQAITFSQDYGYWGGLIFAFLAHTTIIIPVPYTILLVYLGSTGLNVIWLGLMAGLGASIGELTSYLVGLAGGAFVWKKYGQHFKALKKILEKKPRMMPWIIFLFGASPLPDDVLLIPLGMIRYNFFKAVIPMAIGKIILTTIFAWSGQAAAPLVETILYKSETPWASFITIFFVIITVYVILKVDWERLGQQLLNEDK
ncbi:VTT domain-containing protein [Patescibacteria group bacterium]